MKRSYVLVALLLFGCELDFIPEPDGDPNVRFMSFNVGNPDDEEANYPLRLRDQSYEDYVADAIAEWQPDVIALQEVLPLHTCEAFTETDPNRTCFEQALRESPVRRLLGDNYSIVCDSNLQVECVGVHVDFGTIVGLEPGGIDLLGADTPELPGISCNYAAGGCDNNLCDEESSISTIDIETIEHGPMRVIHLHPTASGFTGENIFYLGSVCRTLQTEQAFALAPDNVPTLMLGDWNFDPDNGALYGAERDVFTSHVGPELRFTDHGQRDVIGRRVATVMEDPTGFAIDHVISDFATGSCAVVRAPRFDEEFDFMSLASDGDYSGRIDHHPVLCDLRWD